jgi:mono/diheme cytochrome c family protein
MKRESVARVLVLMISSLVLALSLACGRGQQGRPDVVAGEAPKAPAAASSATERGQYLVTMGHCHDCHTPWKMGPAGPEPDMTNMLSGHPASLQMPAPPPTGGPWAWSGAITNTAFAGPWGISYAINLTPDEETGIGSWSEQVFVNGLRTGRHMGVGRPILPPMPWFNLAKATDEDLKAIYAYLRTVPAKKNQAPDAVVAEPPVPPAAPAAPGAPATKGE